MANRIDLPIKTKHCQAILVAADDQSMALDWLFKEIADQRSHYPQRKLAVLWDGDLQLSTHNQLSQFGNVSVQSLLAGCVCCIGGPVLKSAIVKDLRNDRPDKLWIVGGATALLSAMADAVQSPLLAAHIKVSQTVWLGQSAASSKHVFEQIECATDGVNTNIHNLSVPVHPWALGLNQANADDKSYDYLWPTEALFDRKMVLSTLRTVCEVTTINYRIDGLFRTLRTHYYGASVDAGLTWRDTSWRIDSRIRLTGLDSKEIVVTLNTLREQLEACRTR